jgi:hypothetical protein
MNAELLLSKDQHEKGDRRGEPRARLCSRLVAAQSFEMDSIVL